VVIARFERQTPALARYMAQKFLKNGANAGISLSEIFEI
jgi:hypothetical protein